MTTPREWFGDLVQRSTVAGITQWLRDAAASAHGAICPVCGRYDKVYRRKINRASIQHLCKLHRYASQRGFDRYYHYRDFIGADNRVSDFAKFIFLGLIERASSDDDKVQSSGNYRITTAGQLFVRGGLAIPETMIIYHNELIDTAGDRKFIGAFWPDFDYAELMEASAEAAE